MTSRTLLLLTLPTIITLLGVIVAHVSPLNYAAFCGRLETQQGASDG